MSEQVQCLNENENMRVRLNGYKNKTLIQEKINKVSQKIRRVSRTSDKNVL